MGKAVSLLLSPICFRKIYYPSPERNALLKDREQCDSALTEQQSVNRCAEPSGASTRIRAAWIEPLRGSPWHLLFFFWFFFRAAPGAYGGSQARGLIGATVLTCTTATQP